MARLALGAAGAALGAFVGGAAGASWGWTIGMGIGSMLEPQATAHQDGPRLQQVAQQTSVAGASIPRVYGTMRVSGNVIWADDVVEHVAETTTRSSKKGGGKGGGMSASTSEYTYTQSLAVGLAEGPMHCVRRIWADSTLIYDATLGATVASVPGLSWHFYPGDTSQQPDPRIQQWAEARPAFGDNATPAFRGLAYIVFYDFPITAFGNRLPTFSFELAQAGVATDAAPLTSPIAISSWGDFWLQPQMNGPYILYSSVGALSRIDTLTGRVTAQAFIRHDHGHIYDMASCWPGILHNGDILAFADVQGGGQCFLVIDGVSLQVKRVGQAMQLDASTREHLKYADFYCPRFDAPYAFAVYAPFEKVFMVDLNTLALMHVAVNGQGTVTSSPQEMPGYAHAIPPAAPGSYITWANIDDYGRLWYIMGVDYMTTKAGSTYICRLDPLGQRHEAWHVPAEEGGFVAAIIDEYTEALWLMGSPPVAGQTYLTSNGHLYRWSWDSHSLDGITVASPVALDVAFSNIQQVVRTPRFYTSYGGRVYEIDTATGGILKNFGMVGQAVYDPVTHSLVAVGEGYLRIFRLDRTEVSDATVAQIVLDICRECGVTGSEMDTGDLTGLTCSGFARTSVMQARSVLEALQKAYMFDIVESAGKLTCVRRGKEPVRSIPWEDLAAHEEGQEQPEPVHLVRQQEVELPREVIVGYASKAHDYQPGTQRAMRQVGGSLDVAKVDLPLVLEDNQALRIAECLLQAAWVGRTSANVVLSTKHFDLEPGDVITLEDERATHTVRIDKVSFGDPGLLVLELRSDAASAYQSSAVASEAWHLARGIPYVGPSTLAVIDAPLTYPPSSHPELFLAASSPFPGWSGCTVMESDDGGTFWYAVGSLTRSLMGTALSAPDGGVSPGVWDCASELHVTLFGNAALASSDELAVLNGANWALLGNEIIAYKEATRTDASGNIWCLRGLLRGLRGTEWAMSSHMPGDVFLPLPASTVRTVGMDVTDIGQVIKCKPSSLGDIGTDQTRSITFTGANVKPYAPALQTATRSAESVSVSWFYRSRWNAEWRDLVDVALTEADERYDIDVLVGDTKLRTVTIGPERVVTYSLADFQADTNNAQSATLPPLTIRIYQLSPVVGRGYPLTVEV